MKDHKAEFYRVLWCWALSVTLIVSCHMFSESSKAQYAICSQREDNRVKGKINYSLETVLFLLVCVPLGKCLFWNQWSRLHWSAEGGVNVNVEQDKGKRWITWRGVLLEGLIRRPDDHLDSVSTFSARFNQERLKWCHVAFRSVARLSHSSSPLSHDAFNLAQQAFSKQPSLH